MRVKEAQFLIKYEGSDDSYHELDASLLSQALMAFSEMGRIAYREAHPEDTHTLNVKVQAFNAGSFEVVLEAAIPTIEHLYGQFVGLFNKPDATAAANAVGIAGIISAAFKLVKWISGRKYNATVNGDETSITTEDGDTTTVPTIVFNVAGNAKFINAAGNGLSPLDDPNYDHMSIKNSNGEILDTTYEDDRGYFKVDSDALEGEESLTLEVGIETVQVTAAHRTWTFRSGDQKFNAKVLDEDFQEYMRKTGYPINEDTRATVLRREVKKRDSAGRITSKFYIDKVLKINNPGEDLKLF